MQEMVEARKDADKLEERHDLFSGLLDAAQDEPGSEAVLSDDELIGSYLLSDHFAFIEVVLPPLLGNMFIFLLAGHEVRSFPFFLLPRCPYTVPTDYIAYTLFLICLACSISC